MFPRTPCPQSALRLSPVTKQVTGVLRRRVQARLLRPQHRAPLGLLQRQCAQEALFCVHEAWLCRRVNQEG